MRKALLILLLLAAQTLSWGAPAQLSSEAINSASLTGWTEPKKTGAPDPAIIRTQVLLDRAHISPGVVDGFPGDNLIKAIRAFEEREGLQVDGKIDDNLWSALSRDSAPVIQTYRIEKADLEQHYVEEIPEDFGKMAELKWLGYTSPKEMLAERFHIDEELLEQMNPNADFGSAGTEIQVPAVRENATEKVKRIVVDQSEGQLLAFAGERVLLAYPATIGSNDNPSPSGTHKVKAVVKEPIYTYNPDKNFQQGDNDKPLQIPAGPNGPVGLVWIDLSKPTYGIHGTAEPDLIDKTNSHGCVRLSNWDALELADVTEAGVSVEFRE